MRIRGNCCRVYNPYTGKEPECMRKPNYGMSSYRTTGRKRFSPLMLIGALTLVVLALIALAASVLPRMASHAAGVNGDCTLIVPAQPLTAQGLATPYQLTATDPANGPCNEANKAQAAFVQGAVFDPATGGISIYNPLVIDQGSQPAVPPVVPTLPPGAVIAIWFGFNGNNLTLQGSGTGLQEANCVNGIEGSIFGQFAYCNARVFFQAVNQAIQAGKLAAPPLGTAKDGETCPSVRDFSVVDMDQSDNVTTTYLVTPDGRTAQATAANMAALQNAQVQVNGSDNRLLAVGLDGALGCSPWMAPDLADPGKMVSALPLNELQAAARQGPPVALVPDRDPMVLVNNQPNLQKVNAYRFGVDQPPAGNLFNSNTRIYCAHLRAIGPQRMLLDAPFTIVSPSPDPAVANSLLTFLEQRFVATYEANGLNCLQLLGMPDPVTVTADANGVAIGGSINGVMNGTQPPTSNNAPDCVVNGTTIPGCNGTAKIGGRICAITF